MRRKTGVAAKPETIDDYLASLPDDKRAALERLRGILLAAVPGAEECISYGVPTLRLDGKHLVSFGASAKHCSFYPGAIVEAFKTELEGYDTSKGTIRFQPDEPLPARLVKKLVKGQAGRKKLRH